MPTSRTKNPSRIPTGVWNGLLIVLSLIAGLAVCEAALRLADTRYEQAAEPPLRKYRWPNTRPHPDAETEHEVLYNRFGNRQHRDFGERHLQDGMHVAFFGDSFTEGLEVPVQYTFVEVLDHLLNGQVNAQESRAQAYAPHSGVHVHNFGMFGTGPGSQYLRYRGFPHKDRLRHVFYVHCDNDFADLRHAGLYALNATGELVRRMRRTSAWIRFLSGFRLTYLALDVWQRLAGGMDGGPVGEDRYDAVHDGDVVFEAILSRWRDEAEANGSAFHVILLPVPGTAAQFHRRVRSGLFDVFDLRDCFEQEIPGFVWKDWRFRSNSHWNEAGHMVAAHCLYRFLESRLGLARAPDEALAQARHTYYRAFADDAGWPGHRFMPDAPWALPAPGPLNPAASVGIRAKHLALESEGEGQRRRVVREVRQEEPLARKGGWAVYASPRHRVVVYVKSPCGKGGNDPAGRLFLHALAPAIAGTHRDWTELELDGVTAFWRDGGDCVVARPVGRYSPIAKLRTGEWRERPGGAVLWEAEFPFDPAEREAAATAAHQREYEAVAERPAWGRPHGNWSVHVLDNSMALLKEPCATGDLRGSFFLRMYPADPAAAAHELTPRGFAAYGWRTATGNQPRRTLWGTKYSRFVAVRVDGKCLLKATLPSWVVATIWAGQKDGEAVVWETTFHLNVERHRRAWAAVRSGAPLARSVFDIHRRGGNLVYVRDPCDEGDAAARFFLHVFAGAAWANLDFDFNARGVVADGRCVAMARLPEQDIDGIRTGQFVPGEGELWSVEL